MNKANKFNLLIYIIIADMCLLPTWHFAGLPFKITYLIALIWLSLFLFFAGFRSIRNESSTIDDVLVLERSKQAKRILLVIMTIIIVTIFGEITTSLYTSLVDTSSFRNAIFFYIILICNLGIGYVAYDYKKEYLIIIMSLYCFINIIFSALGNSTPSFLLNLYNFTDEKETLLSSLRIVGIMGNPNATLCIMNMLFMSIVVFIKIGKIKVENKFKLTFIILLPLITNCFINSRGEFLVTVILEVVLIYTVFKKQKSLLKIVLWLFITCILISFIFFVAFDYLAEKYPTVAYSINRLKSIFDNDSNIESDSISYRPFIHYDEFIGRFLTSPIWGTGFSTGTEFPFQRSCQSYHNDWFRIIASCGIIGFCLWIYLIIVSVRKCGLFYIIPFFITGISNTFIGSYAALSIYFMTVMAIIRYEENGQIGRKEDKKN